MKRFECPRCGGIMYPHEEDFKCCSCELEKTLVEATDDGLDGCDIGEV